VLEKAGRGLDLSHSSDSFEPSPAAFSSTLILKPASPKSQKAGVTRYLISCDRCRLAEDAKDLRTLGLHLNAHASTCHADPSIVPAQEDDQEDRTVYGNIRAGDHFGPQVSRCS
jgi:hypothetical protein